MDDPAELIPLDDNPLSSGFRNWRYKGEGEQFKSWGGIQPIPILIIRSQLVGG